MVQTALSSSSSKRERQSELQSASSTAALLRSLFGICPFSFYRSRLDALFYAFGLLKTHLFVSPKVASSAADGAVAASGQSQSPEQTSTPPQNIDLKKLFHAFAHQLLEVLRSLRAAYADRSSNSETVASCITRPQLLESLVARLETLDTQWDAFAENSPTPEKQLLSLVDCAHLLIKT